MKRAILMVALAASASAFVIAHDERSTRFALYSPNIPRM